MDYIILNHQPVPAQEALVPVHDRGFRYGDGVFETLRVCAGVPYRFDWHMARLKRGIAALKIVCDLTILEAESREILAFNKVQEGFLRLQITRGSGSRGYLPDPANAYSGVTTVVETAELYAVPSEPVELWLSSYERISPRALPAGIKLCQGVNSTLARLEAQENKCFDALQLNQHGQLCETSSANLFWLKEGALYTPATSCGIVEGSIRSAVMTLSPYPVHEIEADVKTLAQAQAVFITNVAWLALPVRALIPSGLRWNSIELARTIHGALIQDMHAYGQRHRARWQ